MTLVIEYTDRNNFSSLIHCSKLTNQKPLTNLIVFTNYRHRFRKMRDILLHNKPYFLTSKANNHEHTNIGKKNRKNAILFRRFFQQTLAGFI